MSTESENNIWADDLLGREEDADLIRRFLVGRRKTLSKDDEPKAYVLNLDSKWGGGKTFFLLRFKKFLEANNHVCAYVNAWNDDHSDDPLIAVVSAINEQIGSVYSEGKVPAPVKTLLAKVSKNAGKIATKAIVATAKQAAKKALGETEFGEIAESLAEETVDALAASALDSFNSQKNTNTSFTADLNKMIQTLLENGDKEGPVFVLIDELDRCRPS